MKLRILIAVIGAFALASSVFGQSGGGFTISPSGPTGGGNTTALGQFSLTGAVGQSPIGTIGKKNLTIVGGILGAKTRPFMYGDANTDHVVNVGDLLSMANFLAGN